MKYAYAITGRATGDSMSKDILIVGNLADGLTFYGPFDDAEQATQHAERVFRDEDWCIAELEASEDTDDRASELARSFEDILQPSELDGLVHETAAQQAANINNHSLEAQVEFLIEQLGYETALDELRQREQWRT